MPYVLTAVSVHFVQLGEASRLIRVDAATPVS
jgi:hypothetical protein